MGEILIDITPEQWEALKKSETITIETKNPIPVESGSEVICYILNAGIVGKFEVLEKHDLYPNFYTIPAYETYKYIDGKFEREEE